VFIFVLYFFSLFVSLSTLFLFLFFFFFQAEDGIRDFHVTGVQTCALPIYLHALGRQRRIDRPRCLEYGGDTTPGGRTLPARARVRRRDRREHHLRSIDHVHGGRSRVDPARRLATGGR